MSDVRAIAGARHDARWYLLRTKPREEARALENLARQGFEAFVPHCSAERLVRGRPVRRREPLFPGYAFVSLNETGHNWSVLRSTRGVAHLVRFGTHTPTVDDAVITRLRELDGATLPGPADALAPGDRVRIVAGPLAGLEGVFEQRDGQARVMLLLDWMQRQVRVAVDARTVLPAAD